MIVSRRGGASNTFTRAQTILERMREEDPAQYAFFTDSGTWGPKYYRIPLNVKPTDALLTLSTCVDDDRLVIFARKLRAGETKDEIVSAVEQSVRVA